MTHVQVDRHVRAGILVGGQGSAGVHYCSHDNRLVHERGGELAEEVGLADLDVLDRPFQRAAGERSRGTPAHGGIYLLLCPHRALSVAIGGRGLSTGLGRGCRTRRLSIRSSSPGGAGSELSPARGNVPGRTAARCGCRKGRASVDGTARSFDEGRRIKIFLHFHGRVPAGLEDARVQSVVYGDLLVFDHPARNQRRPGETLVVPITAQRPRI